MRQRIRLFMLMALLAGCARQGSIPNPDRFPPHLTSVNSVNTTRLTLSFDEELDSAAFLPATFTIASDDDTASIRFIAADPNQPGGGNILIITSPLKQGLYRLSGMVADKEGNAATVSSTFKASARKDTVPPIITLTPLQPQTRFPYTVRFTSNEPVDTSKGIRVITAPPVRDEKKLSTSWNRWLTTYTVKGTDSLLAKKPFYVALLPGVWDFAGNRTNQGISAFFYADTTLSLRRMKGEVKTEGNKPAGNAVILLEDSGNNLFALTLADSAGNFLTRVEDRDTFNIRAWFDEERDGYFEQSGRLELHGFRDSVSLTTSAAQAPRSLNQILSGN